MHDQSDQYITISLNSDQAHQCCRSSRKHQFRNLLLRLTAVLFNEYLMECF